MINNNIKHLEKLTGIFFNSKAKNKVDNIIGNSGCKSIFSNAKYLNNLEMLNLGIDFPEDGYRLTVESINLIIRNISYLNKLRELSLEGKSENKIGITIGDIGCSGIFNEAKYITDLEKLNLSGIK